MPNNQAKDQYTEPFNMGLALFSPISSVAGSPTLFFTQPLLNGRVWASTAVLIGAELFLFIAERLFHLEGVPVFDINKGQTLQMPLTELRGFLKWVSNGSAREYMDNSNYTSTVGNRGFVTVESPEAPVVLALTVSSDYSNKPFTSSIWIVFPIVSFPGIRGALPLLILELLATIFVRAVVSPESAGSKPLPETGTNKMNNPLNFSPNDILELLARFRKEGNSK